MASRPRAHPWCPPLQTGTSRRQSAEEDEDEEDEEAGPATPTLQYSSLMDGFEIIAMFPSSVAGALEAMEIYRGAARHLRARLSEGDLLTLQQAVMFTRHPDDAAELVALLRVLDELGQPHHAMLAAAEELCAELGVTPEPLEADEEEEELV